MTMLTVVIPAFNEEATIYELLSTVDRVELIRDLTKELVVVNDHSTDKTVDEINRFTQDHPDCKLRLIEHDRNKGKGAALHTGIKEANGELLIIQDADLEYDPEEYNLLLKPILKGQADIVYGSRFIGGKPHRILFFWHSIGNRILTHISNAFTNLNLTDMETCYKLFKTDLIQGLTLREKRFGFEPEVTAKISRLDKVRIYEVGISYYGRTYDEGKKINWKDGVRAIYCIFKYNIWSRK